MRTNKEIIMTYTRFKPEQKQRRDPVHHTYQYNIQYYIFTIFYISTYLNQFHQHKQCCTQYISFQDSNTYSTYVVKTFINIYTTVCTKNPVILYHVCKYLVCISRETFSSVHVNIYSMNNNNNPNKLEVNKSRCTNTNQMQ